jgi:hypothetical protein
MILSQPNTLGAPIPSESSELSEINRQRIFSELLFASEVILLDNDDDLDSNSQLISSSPISSLNI